MLRSTYEARTAEQTEIQRTLVQGTARLCSSPFGRACKGIWPHKAAERLAAHVGCAVRTAAYEISGDREPSGRSLAVLTDIFTGRLAP